SVRGGHDGAAGTGQRRGGILLRGAAAGRPRHRADGRVPHRGGGNRPPPDGPGADRHPVVKKRKGPPPNTPKTRKKKKTKSREKGKSRAFLCSFFLPLFSCISCVSWWPSSFLSYSTTARMSSSVRISHSSPSTLTSLPA